MKKLIYTICLVFVANGISIAQEMFYGEIQGKLYDKGTAGSFSWIFSEEITTFSMSLNYEGEITEVNLVFDGDTTAMIETIKNGKVENETEISPSQLLSKMPVFINEYKSKGEDILQMNTQKIQVRTQDKEAVTWISAMKLDWNGAEIFFRDDIGFILAVSNGGFPMKTIVTNLKGELLSSFDVTSVKEN